MAAAPKVLIAEDDALQAIALRMALAEFGYEICAVVDTSEAAIALGRRLMPDLAILDVALAHGSNGLDAARYFACEQAIPVVVCSGHAVSLDATLAGAAFFLSKPYCFEELRTALFALLAVGRRQQARTVGEASDARPATVALSG